MMPLFCPGVVPGVLLGCGQWTALKPAAGGTPLFYPRTVRDRCGFSPRDYL